MLFGTVEVLEQRKLYDKMPGVSFGNLCFGFLPAFMDAQSGETHVAINDDGSIALTHTMDNLPLEWVKNWNETGHAVELIDSVQAGFMRGTDFYTLDDLREVVLDD